MSESSDKKTTFGLDEAQIGRLLQLGSDPAPKPSKDNQVGSERSSSTSESGPPLTPAESPQIKGYDVLAKLGEAGQGQVWRALQLSTGREVALKVPRVGSLISDRTRMRFEREVELAARLKHPRIARLLDSGIHQGQYYYVMDLIEGTNLDQYVQTKNLDQTAILKLMVEICQAVQHAHQKGIIHRDLKPSNIIVTEDEVPYLVDFGLAKEILQTDQASDVSLDGETLGTPAYMSPEQAAGHAEQVDTRTDVYSLGVILFHLLTGQLPHDLSGSRYDVLKRIAEGEKKRPRQVNPRLDKDLEILLLKALDREPDRRYTSPGGLAQDIENYLTDAPLIAGPPTTLYRFKKFVRRNAILCAAILVVAVTFILGLAGITAMYFRAERLRHKAEQASQQAQQAAEKETAARKESERFWAQAEAAASFLVKDVLGNDDLVEAPASDPYYGLHIVTEKLEGELVDKPLAEAIIREKVGERYQNLGKPELAIPHLERAYQICLHQLGPDHKRTIAATRPLGWSYVAGGRYDDALLLWNEQLEMIQKVYGEEHRLEVLFMINIGGTYTWAGKYKEGEEILVKALEINERVFKLPYYLEIGSRHLTQNYMAQGRYEEAEKLLLEAIDGPFSKLGDTHPSTLKAIKSLIELYEAWNKPEKAEEWRSKLP